MKLVNYLITDFSAVLALNGFSPENNTEGTIEALCQKLFNIGSMAVRMNTLCAPSVAGELHPVMSDI